MQTAMVLATGELWLFLLQFPLANLCMCVLFARTASGPRPLVAQLAAEVVALRQPADRHPGLHRFFQAATWLWAGIFLLLTAGLAVLMVTEPASMFLMLSTAATIALVAAGTAASALWFLLGTAQARAQAPFRPSLNPTTRTSPPQAGVAGGRLFSRPARSIRPPDHPLLVTSASPAWRADRFLDAVIPRGERRRT